MRPQAQVVATAVIQPQTSDTKHLEDSPGALGFKGSFTSMPKKQDALPHHFAEPLTKNNNRSSEIKAGQKRIGEHLGTNLLSNFPESVFLALSFLNDVCSESFTSAHAQYV